MNEPPRDVGPQGLDLAVGIADRVDEGVILLEVDGRVVYLNRTARVLLALHAGAPPGPAVQVCAEAMRELRATRTPVHASLEPPGPDPAIEVTGDLLPDDRHAVLLLRRSDRGGPYDSVHLAHVLTDLANAGPVTPGALIERLVQRAVDLIPAAASGAAFLMHDGVLRLAALRGVATPVRKALRGLVLPDGVDAELTARQRIVRDGEALLDRLLDPATRRALATGGCRGRIGPILLTPVPGPRGPAGLLSLHAAETGGFDGTTREIVAIVVLHAALRMQRLDLEHSLDLADRRQRQLLNVARFSPAATVVVDLPGGRVVDLNDRFAELLGARRDALLERNLAELLRFDDRHALPAALADLDRGRPVPPEEHELCLTGSGRRVVVAWVPIDLDGRAGAVASLIDVTERHLIENQLQLAIDAALADTADFGRTVLEKLARIRADDDRTPDRQIELHDLTGRERQVLERIGAGYDNARIAAELELSDHTVRNYVSRIYDKLGVHSRAAAVVWARERGLVAE